MAESSGLTHTKTITDLTGAVQAWRQWLVSEKRASDHTLSAYERDLEQFLDFLQDHLGAAPDIPDLATLRPADFRGYLARRAAKGFAKAPRRVPSPSSAVFFAFLNGGASLPMRPSSRSGGRVFLSRYRRRSRSLKRQKPWTLWVIWLQSHGSRPVTLPSSPCFTVVDCESVKHWRSTATISRKAIPLPLWEREKSSGSYQYCPPCAPPSTITLSAAPITVDRTIRFFSARAASGSSRCRPARDAVGTGLAESAGNRNAPRPEAFLCHPPVGRWWRSAGNSGTAWPCLTGDDSTLYQRRCGAADGCA